MIRYSHFTGLRPTLFEPVSHIPLSFNQFQTQTHEPPYLRPNLCPYLPLSTKYLTHPTHPTTFPSVKPTILWSFSFVPLCVFVSIPESLQNQHIWTYSLKGKTWSQKEQTFCCLNLIYKILHEGRICKTLARCLMFVLVVVKSFECT